MDIQISFLYQFSPYEVFAALFIAMLIAYLAGNAFSNHKLVKGAENKFGPIESAVLGLLALILAFSFGQSASRFDARRLIMVEEANNIASAIRKADVYEESDRIAFRADLKQYLEMRITFYDARLDLEKVIKSLEESDAISRRLWERASLLGRNRDNFIASSQMLPALTAMMESVVKRNSAGLATLPDSIMWVLFSLCLLTSFNVGFAPGLNRPWWLGVGVFIIAICTAIFLIVDLDHPRQGNVTLDSPQKNFYQIRRMFE